ncbi:MAG: Spo0E family sporulation regulatory protein-aspartic acid phosphatase [Bacillota bacterium]|nr:sporulation protein Spo0E [Bacillota bacterium]HWR55316.1 Spo0E family sporulation regulatory protein-aspartic acid phosphatase [Negativicutes bacterium]
MSNAASTAIEELRKNLYAAAKNAAYNYQCKEVQQINAQLDKLICRFMKKQTGKIR